MRRNNGMKVGLVLSLFGLSVGGAIIGHHVLAAPPAQFVAGGDLSGSVKRDCAGLVSETKRVIAEIGPEDGSTLTLLGTGHTALNPQPVRLFDQAVPVPSDALFGKDEAGFEAKRASFFSAFQKSCETAPTSKDSPILQLVVGGIAHLRSRGCTVNSQCVMVIFSDLDENSDPALRSAIGRAAKESRATLPPKLAAKIDNAGIRVTFCGTSEVEGLRSRRHATPEAMATLWKAIFSHPDLVSFQPYCGH